MALLRDVLMNIPSNFSNHILSRRNRLDMKPGVLYPVFCEEILPGDHIRVMSNCQVSTAPVLAPLMSSHSIEISYFFVPTRLYVQSMDINRIQFDASEIVFPTAPPVSFARVGQWDSSKESVMRKLYGLPDNTSSFAIQRNSPSQFDPTEIRYDIDVPAETTTDEVAGIGQVLTAFGNRIKGIDALYTSKTLAAYLDFQGSQESYTTWFGSDTWATGPFSWATGQTYGAAQGALRTSAAVLFRNCIPSVGYYDIFRNYYANTQEDSFYMNAYSVSLSYLANRASAGAPVIQHIGLLTQAAVDPTANGGVLDSLSVLSSGEIEQRNIYQPPFVTWCRRPLSYIDDFINEFVKGSVDFCSAWNTTIGKNNQYGTLTQVLDVFEALPFCPHGIVPVAGEFGRYEFASHDLLGSVADHGLVCRTYSPDFNTVWLSSGTYAKMLESSRINVQNNQVTVQQIRTASHLLEYDERGLIGGGRYDDWVYSQFGRRVRTRLCIPDYLGRYKSLIVFDDLYSTNASDDSQTLGRLGGKGHGSVEADRPISLTSPEHGYLIALASIAPEVSYCDGYSDMYDKTEFQDVYAPVLDRIGFAPRMVKNMAGTTDYAYSNTFTTDSGGRTANGMFSTWNNVFKMSGNDVVDRQLAVGYLPAWTEYTTAIDRVHGAFCRNNELSYWVLSRQFNPGSFYSDRYDKPISTTPTSYVLPFQFKYPFADDTADHVGNFYAQFVFDAVVSRRIGKTVMPTLA